MSAKTFEEWDAALPSWPNSPLENDNWTGREEAYNAGAANARAALLADRPEVAGAIVLCRRALDRDETTLTADQALASQCLPALESLAAQLAQRDEDIAKLKGHAEAMAEAIQFGDMAILTVAKAAAESYRSDYPKGPK